MTDSALSRVKDMTDGPTPDQDWLREEHSALLHLALGLTERQAAAELSVSEATFRRILQRARQRLGATSTTNAIYIAAKQGLI